MDDVTRQLLIREGQKLSSPVYEALDAACAETMKDLKFSGHDHPHLHGLYRRAAFRTNLASGDLPEGWRVGGNSRQSEQLILEHSDHNATLRVLAESTVTANGVPHAGSNGARREAWSVQVPLFNLTGSNARRDLLLLCRVNLPEPTVRLVRTVSPGKYKGVVECDFGLPLMRDGSAVYHGVFPGDSEEVDLFSVEIESEESSDA